MLEQVFCLLEHFYMSCDVGQGEGLDGVTYVKFSKQTWASSCIEAAYHGL